MSDADPVSILLVDDLPDKLLVYRSILEELGENIVTARSGQEALKQVLRHNFAVILLDVNMPDIDGFETAQLIRKRQKSAHTPIIFLTSYYDDLRPHRGYAHGAVDYILAPVEPGILKAKVKVFVDLFRLHRQVERRAEERVMLAEEQAKRLAAESANRNSAFLAQASRALANSLDVWDTQQTLARVAVPFLADWSAVWLTEETGSTCHVEWARQAGEELQRFHASLPDHEIQGELRQAMERSAALGEAVEVAPSSVVECIRKLQSSEPPTDWNKVVILPLTVREKSLGCLVLAQACRESWDQVIAEDLASRGAIALDNALLVRNIRDADRRKDEFLAMLAHELRNPLAPIQNAVEILRLVNTKEPRVDRARELIDRQTRHLTRLVDDLLDVSRITRGKIKLQMEVFALNTAVEHAVETCRSLLETRQQNLRFQLPEKPIYIKGDPARVIQIVCNLLNNAAKFSENHGTIQLELKSDGIAALLSVHDSGEGIPTEMLSSIFEPFVQAHASPDRVHGGLGIGLTLVRRLVELHDGSVSAFSEGKGKGSEFVVRLPLSPDPPVRLESAAVATDSAGVASKRIVLVSNAPMNADVVEQ